MQSVKCVHITMHNKQSTTDSINYYCLDSIYKEPDHLDTMFYSDINVSIITVNMAS